MITGRTPTPTPLSTPVVCHGKQNAVDDIFQQVTRVWQRARDEQMG